MHFAGGEGCLEVEAEGLWRENVLPLLACSLYQHLGGVSSLLSQLLLGVAQLLAYPAAYCQSKERERAVGRGPRGLVLWGTVTVTPEVPTGSWEQAAEEAPAMAQADCPSSGPTSSTCSLARNMEKPQLYYGFHFGLTIYLRGRKEGKRERESIPFAG